MRPAESAAGRPRLLVFYHFLPPDDVVSAQLLGGLCEGLVRRGWEVEARPSNRSCHEDGVTHARREEWRGVSIRRVGRLPLPQRWAAGRVLNAISMTAAWGLAALGPGPGPDVVLVGTDPILSVLALPVWRLFRRGVRRAHWVFDLYPDAAVADGVVARGGVAERVLRGLARAGVGAAHLVADIGPCMRGRVPAAPGSSRATLCPWALLEPPEPLEPDPVEREALFGKARLGVLYSGSFGRAHSFDGTLSLARRLRGSGIHFTFAVRGNREPELRAAVTPEDGNVSFAPFVEEGSLEKRLGAADVHAVSLRPEWTGAVVPSKFQAALAAGRPVLFAGSPQASPARWIEEHGLGWVLTPETVEPVAARLLEYVADPVAASLLRARCHAAYHRMFSRERTISSWDAALRALWVGRP